MVPIFRSIDAVQYILILSCLYYNLALCSEVAHLNCNILLFEDINECEVAELNNCTQICMNLNGSFSCACDTGYRLLDDQATCEG